VKGTASPEFEWLFRSTYASVLRTSFLILHDQGAAEEVTQDAFLRLYERWHSVAEVDHPSAWVRRVATRAAVKRARRARSSPATGPVHVSASDAIPNIDLLRAVAGLSAQQRAAVALYYLEDRPVAQVADLMGVSASTVKQHLHRARGELSRTLDAPAAAAHEGSHRHAD
jgi:RNA polymerase sigma factor (sigma-70 family)